MDETNKRQFDARNWFLFGVESGYKACERGKNIQAAIQDAKAEFNRLLPDYPQESAQENPDD